MGCLKYIHFGCILWVGLVVCVTCCVYIYVYTNMYIILSSSLYLYYVYVIEFIDLFLRLYAFVLYCTNRRRGNTLVIYWLMWRAVTYPNDSNRGVICMVSALHGFSNSDSCYPTLSECPTICPPDSSLLYVHDFPRSITKS